MRRTANVVLVGLATLGVAAVAGPATAHPASTPKPTGTIFFFRENAAQNGQNAFSMTATGKKVHRVPHIGTDFPALPAPKAHEIISTVQPAQFVRSIGVSTYAGKVKHVYKSKTFDQVVSVSPNGKYLGAEISQSAGAAFAITTIKGKNPKILFSWTSVPPTVAESWNPTSTQVAVVDTNPNTNKSTLKIYNLKGKVVRTLLTGASLSGGLSWSASGVLAYTTGHEIAEIRATGGNPHLLIDLGANYPYGVSYSPNGAFLAYGVDVVSTPDTFQVWRATAAGASRVEINGKGSQPHWG